MHPSRVSIGRWSEREARLVHVLGGNAGPESMGGAEAQREGPKLKTLEKTIDAAAPSDSAREAVSTEVTKAQESQVKKTADVQMWADRFNQAMDAGLKSPRALAALKLMEENYGSRLNDPRMRGDAVSMKQGIVDQYVVNPLQREADKERANVVFRAEVDQNLNVSQSISVGPEAPPQPAPGVEAPKPLPGTPAGSEAPKGDGKAPAAAPSEGKQQLDAAEAKMKAAKTPIEGLTALAEYVGVMLAQVMKAFEGVYKVMDRKAGEAPKDPEREALAKKVSESKESPGKVLTDARDAAKAKGDQAEKSMKDMGTAMSGLETKLADAKKPNQPTDVLQAEIDGLKTGIEKVKVALAAARKEEAAASKLLGEVQQANVAMKEKLAPELKALTERTGGKVTFETSLDARGEIMIRITGLDPATINKMGLPPTENKVLLFSISAFKESVRKMTAAPEGSTTDRATV